MGGGFSNGSFGGKFLTHGKSGSKRHVEFRTFFVGAKKIETMKIQKQAKKTNVAKLAWKLATLGEVYGTSNRDSKAHSVSFKTTQQKDHVSKRPLFCRRPIFVG